MSIDRLISGTDRFFFRKISASGFGMMRIAWAAIAFIFLLFQWQDVAFFYSDAGLVPNEMGANMFRTAFRFTIFDWISDPTQVYVVYAILLASLLLMMIGMKTRLATIVSVLLLFSFQERNLLPLTGGDTVLRNIGFILMIAPELRAYSWERYKEQWKQWRKTRSFLPNLQMSIWPYRLLLWQLIVIYVMTGWEKMIGSMWLNGTAAALPLMHPDFARWSQDTMAIFAGLSPFVSSYTIVFEMSWLLLLIPSPVINRLKVITYGGLKRTLIYLGVLFHFGIWLLLVVGSFSWTMMMGYLGLLADEDFDVIRNWWNRKWQSPISVLFDGHCGFCQRSMFSLLMMDCLHRLHAADFQDEKNRKAIAPNLTYDELDKAIHIQKPDGSFLTGFDGFRYLCWHLPALWPAAPLLYIPGVPYVGRIVYARIAERRKKCTHDGCVI